MHDYSKLMLQYITYELTKELRIAESMLFHSVAGGWFGLDIDNFMDKRITL